LKTKFISLIVSVAVILGLVLVPAAVLADPGDEWAYEIQPGTSTASASSSFSVNISCVQWDTGDSDGWEAYVRYNTTYLSVTGITIPATLPPPNNLAPDKYLAPGAGIYGLTTNPGYNNTEGILYVGYSPQAATPKLNQTFWFATIDFATTAAEGVTSINFTDVDAGHITEILLGATEVQNWAKFVNGTVIIGTPNLQVCVNPVAKGTVTADGTPLVMTAGCNTTARSFSDVVALVASPVAGWEFDSWTGDVANANAASTTVTIDTTTMNMTTLTKSVTANFEEKPPILDVDTNALSFSGRFGVNEANDTVTISNDGGHLLNWMIGSPPEWGVGDSWLWNNVYGTPTNNVTISVTSTSDPDNYEANVTFTNFFTPNRKLNISNPAPPPPYLYPNATPLNGSVLVDKYGLDFVQQKARLSVPALGGSGIVDATLIYDVTSGSAGWPYSPSKTWSYNINATLVTPIGTLVEPTKPVVAVVTNYTNVTPAALGSVPLGMWCWETTHLLGGTTAFMFTYWNDDIRNFVATFDAGTYNYPPMDVRTLGGAPVLTTPPPVTPPSWVSFDKTSGSLGIGGSEVLTVTANTSGQAVGMYYGNFTISAPGSVQEETVSVTLEVLPATTTDVIRDLPGNAMQVNQTYPGDTFDVYVNFTAPFDKMNAVSLTDLAPDGWEVAVIAANCLANDTIPADYVKATGNKVEVTWWGDPNVGFDLDTNFSALYQVTVPETAKPGINEWPLNDGDKAWAEYYEGEAGAYTSNVTGEYQMMITVCGSVVGETRDVNANLLPDTDVVLKKGVASTGDDESTPDYSIDVCSTGVYWLQANKDAFYTVETPEIGGHPVHNANHTQYIDWSTPELLAAAIHIVDSMNVTDLDFEGDYGLVPQSCTMSYAMKSVNLYVFSPAPVYDVHNGVVTGIDSFGLSVWKATRSVMSWQNPYHP
jgi:hypothetical protein